MLRNKKSNCRVSTTHNLALLPASLSQSEASNGGWLMFNYKYKTMKQFFITSVFLAFSFLTFGQQFSFPIYFHDAIGNKDTLILGYDINGTDSIDAAFGEINIISKPLNTTLDVRITDEWIKRLYSSTGTFHTKKLIVKNYCGSSFSISEIDISTKHWPVTASWDSSLFNDICRNGSVFTSINPGGWWDTGSPSDLWRTELRNTNQVTFTSNNPSGYNNAYAYINNAGDTIPVFWQTFGDSTLLLMGIKEIENLNVFQIYPNPAINYITIQSPQNSTIDILNIQGQTILQRPLQQGKTDINISDLVKGVYILRLLSNDKMEVVRIVKE